MDRLVEIFGKENVLKDEPMSRHTTFRIGGAADFFVKVQTISQLQKAMRYLKKEQIPFYIVGNGSNLLVRDEGVRGVVLHMSKEKALPDFDSDQMDQLSWMFWTAAWLQDARRIAKPGAPVCLFIDWRQLPAMTLALQWAGWTWRGVAVWDKVASRPQKGRFRQQSEYIVWGSNGKMPLERNVGCLPGVFRYPNPQNRIHVTEKPLQLMRDVVQICEPGGRILDPFAGAGTTVLAAVQEGYEAVGIEMSDAYFRRSAERLKTALESEVNQN